jgi:hypothetical protein
MSSTVENIEQDICTTLDKLGELEEKIDQAVEQRQTNTMCNCQDHVDRFYSKLENDLAAQIDLLKSTIRSNFEKLDSLYVGWTDCFEKE